jgi:hypothetical protein
MIRIFQRAFDSVPDEKMDTRMYNPIAEMSPMACPGDSMFYVLGLPEQPLTRSV